MYSQTNLKCMSKKHHTTETTMVVPAYRVSQARHVWKLQDWRCIREGLV